MFFCTVRTIWGSSKMPVASSEESSAFFGKLPQVRLTPSLTREGLVRTLPYHPTENTVINKNLLTKPMKYGILK